MSGIFIPTIAEPFYALTVVLEGKPYNFDFRYNQREDSWYFSLALEDGTELIGGQRVVCDTNLLARCRDVRKPPGYLTAKAIDSNTEAPGLDELGADKRVTMIYLSSDEFVF